MEDGLQCFLKRAQFEKCKGELRALVALFDFCPKWINRTEMDADSMEKRELFEGVQKYVEDFIKHMEDNFIS